MKAEPPPLTIAKPCPKKWSDMTGDAKRRFCEQCQLHVHNLSAMEPGERAQFVAETRGHACITYELRADGTMITRSRWDWVLRPLRAFAALLAALLPFAFSSCATRRLAGSPPSPYVPTQSEGVKKNADDNVIVGKPMPVEKPGKPQGNSGNPVRAGERTSANGKAVDGAPLP